MIYSCLCKAQFCYLCGEEWKTCTCTQWHEERLLARAEVVVDRQNVGVQVPVAERAQRVQQMMEEIVQHHECDHDVYWTRVRWQDRCEECNEWKKTILRCPNCHIQMCDRCKRNRL